VLAYELALNAFLLSGGLGRALSENPESLLVTYRSGWSVIPGHVVARGLRIRSKDGNVEFDLRIERCSFRVVLWELLARRFHVSRVDGDGITFVSRLRIEAKDATGRVLSAIPQIEGLEAVPVKGINSPPPDDAHYKLWTVALDDVHAESVHEVWVDAFRFVGDARVVGGFYLRPTRWAHVGPGATAFVRAGFVTTAGYAIASDVSGRIEATVDPFDPRVTGGIHVFRQGSGRVLLDAAVPGLAFARHWLDDKGIAVRGGAGEAHVDVRIDHGRLAPGTRAEARFRHVAAAHARGAVTGDLEVSASEDTSAGGTRFQVDAQARAVRIVPKGFASAALEAPAVEFRVTDGAVDFVDQPLAHASLTVRLARAELPDAHAAQALLLGSEGSVRLEGGRGSLQAQLDVQNGVGRGSALVALDGMRVALGAKERVTGDVRVQIMVREWGLGSGRADLAGSSAEVLSVRAPGGTEGWWAKAKLESATVDPVDTSFWHSRVVAQARDTRPLVAAFVDASSLPSWLTPLLTSPELHADAVVTVGRNEIDVRDLVADAGPVRGKATLLLEQGESNRAPRGTAVLSVGPLSVGIDVHDGRSSFELNDAEGWYRRAAANLR
jgi:hypothetical protein